MNSSPRDGVHVNVEGAMGQAQLGHGLVELTGKGVSELSVMESGGRGEDANPPFVYWRVDFQAGGTIGHFVFGQHLSIEESCTVVLVV